LLLPELELRLVPVQELLLPLPPELEVRVPLLLPLLELRVELLLELLLPPELKLWLPELKLWLPPELELCEE
jgi:hypothetical protein